MKNIKSITTMIVTLAAISVVMLIPTSAQAQTTTYHTGWIWSNHSDHTNELDANGSVPVALVTSKLNNIGKATGTTDAQIQAELVKAINDWNSKTDAKLHRDDTTTFYFDNEVGSKNYPSLVFAKTQLDRHGLFFKHDHLTRATINFNSDSKDVLWDHNGDNGATRPVTMNIYNTMLHEMGHFLGLCGTYQGDNQSSGDCTIVTSTDTAMRSYPWGSSDRVISSSDKTEINSKY